MSKDLRAITINAVADNSEPSGYRFWMVEDGNTISRLTFNKTKDGLKKSQFYALTFVLDSTNNAGLAFSKDYDKVFWAKEIPNEQAPCVNSACHLPGVFVDSSQPIGDRQLNIINVNRKRQMFAFAFNFLRPGDTDGPGTNYALYDPVGSNENSGSNFTMESAMLVGFGGLAIGAALGTFVIAPALS